jgi:hypothetical protein
VRQGTELIDRDSDSEVDRSSVGDPNETVTETSSVGDSNVADSTTASFHGSGTSRSLPDATTDSAVDSPTDSATDCDHDAETNSNLTRTPEPAQASESDRLLPSLLGRDGSDGEGGYSSTK